MSSHDHGEAPAAHGHSHGLVDESVKRSQDGIRAVALSLLVLALTAAAQLVVFAVSGSVALLADLIHNAGDAATALPLGIAFALRSPSAERKAGLFVVLAIFVSEGTHPYAGDHALCDRRVLLDFFLRVEVRVADPVDVGGRAPAVARCMSGQRMSR